MPIEKERLWARIQEACETTNDSEIARKGGVTAQAISQSRKKNAVPQAETLANIADSTGVSIIWLLFEEGEKRSSGGEDSLDRIWTKFENVSARLENLETAFAQHRRQVKNLKERIDVDEIVRETGEDRKTIVIIYNALIQDESVEDITKQHRFNPSIVNKVKAALSKTADPEGLSERNARRA